MNRQKYFFKWVLETGAHVVAPFQGTDYTYATATQKWLTVEGEIRVCGKGFHACPTIRDAKYWMPALSGAHVLWIVEFEGPIVSGDCKAVSGKMRFVYRLGPINERNSYTAYDIRELVESHGIEVIE